jgi:hypothetical protein
MKEKQKKSRQSMRRYPGRHPPLWCGFPLPSFFLSIIRPSGSELHSSRSPSRSSVQPENYRQSKLVNLLGLGGLQAGLAVEDLDVELVGARDDGLPDTGTDVAGDLGGELAVGHLEGLKILDVVDPDLLEAVGEGVPGLLVSTVTDLGEEDVTLEPPASAVIKTLGHAPALLQTGENITRQEMIQPVSKISSSR